MNTERLLKLAKYLDKVPAEKFDLSTWKCGTTACAVGHACGMPEFKKLGLRISRNSVSAWDPKDWVPAFKGDHGWLAVMGFFDIDYNTAEFLFASDRYENEADTLKEEVAERIRQGVEEYLENQAQPS